MTEGKIVDWLVNEGDEVSAGQVVMVVESDKADMDVESFDEGIVAHIATPSGSSGKVGEVVAYLAATKDEVAKVKAYAESLGMSSTSASPSSPPPPAPEQVKVEAPVSSAAASSIVNEGRIIASPYAKKVAQELGVDLKYVRGTGDGGAIVEKDVRLAASSLNIAPAAQSGKIVATPDAKKIAKKEGLKLETVKGTGNFGRITADDVLRAAGKLEEPSKTASIAKAGSDAAPSKPRKEVPEGATAMSAMQKAVVKNMNAALEVPVFRVTYSIKTTSLDALYAKIKSKGVTMSALLAKAVAMTLEQHPIMNARYEPDSILYSQDINVGMAVALPDGGLITPVLQKANEMDIYSLSRRWKDLVKRAMEKKLSPAEYSTGNFIISNLGMFGVDSFDAILPPGTGSILAVSASKPVVCLGKNGLVAVEKEMKVNITCDHRHIYGAQAAEFLRDLAKLIEENTETLLM